MVFNISAFSHPGTERSQNEDCILVNGHLMNEGDIHLSNEPHCICFVADGVGGNRGGSYASGFVLDKFKLIKDFEISQISDFSKSINEQLLLSTSENDQLKGAATTLSGLVLLGDICLLLNAGDSQIWLLRNDMFFQITTDHVLDDLVPNSPITNYFGGKYDHLELEIKILNYDLLAGDIYIICSDGLFKSLNQKKVKSIVNSDETNDKKTQEILKSAIEAGANDNISVILVQIDENAEKQIN